MARNVGGSISGVTVDDEKLVDETSPQYVGTVDALHNSADGCGLIARGYDHADPTRTFCSDQFCSVESIRVERTAITPPARIFIHAATEYFTGSSVSRA
jgi:hypothetical protein